MLPREQSFMLFGLNVRESSWRGVLLLFGIYFGAMLLAALLSPPIYACFQWWAEVHPNRVSTYLAGKGLDDFFERIRMVPVVLGLPFLLKACGLLSLRNLGVRFSAYGLGRMMGWFLVGAGLVFIIALGQLFFGETMAKPGLSGWQLLKIPMLALLSGLILGLIEEIVFRGMVFRMFYTAVRPWLAIGLCSLFFAYTHFKLPGALTEVALGSETWSSGLMVAYGTTFGIFYEFALIDFLSLLALSCLLCLMTLRTRSLMGCIGFHAGAVWMMITYRGFIWVGDGENRWWWGGTGIVDGVFPLLLMLAVCGWLGLGLYRSSRSGKEPAESGSH